MAATKTYVMADRATILGRLGWVLAVPAIVIACVLAWTTSRQPGSYETQVIQVIRQGRVVCVPEAPGATERVCGWLFSDHPDQIQSGSKVTVTVHEVDGIGSVIEVEPIAS